MKILSWFGKSRAKGKQGDEKTGNNDTDQLENKGF